MVNKQFPGPYADYIFLRALVFVAPINTCYYMYRYMIVFLKLLPCHHVLPVTVVKLDVNSTYLHTLYMDEGV